MRIKRPFVSQSPVTNELLKRKRALEELGGEASAWLALAEDFLADDGKMNYAYCMNEYKRLGGEIELPSAFTYIPEPDVPEWMDRKDMQ